MILLSIEKLQVADFGCFFFFLIEYLLHLGLCNQLMAMLWLNCVVLYYAETKEQLNPM